MSTDITTPSATPLNQDIENFCAPNGLPRPFPDIDPNYRFNDIQCRAMNPFPVRPLVSVGWGGGWGPLNDGTNQHQKNITATIKAVGACSHGNEFRLTFTASSRRGPRKKFIRNRAKSGILGH